MKSYLSWTLAGLMGLVVIAGCSTTEPVTTSSRDLLSQKVTGAIATVKYRLPSTHYFFKHAYAYAVFPDVGGGAIGIGGAAGRGEVFRNGQMAGYCKLVQGTIGAQLGGQTFTEVVFFQNAASFADFESGQTTFDARATAVAANAGVGTAANYQRGTLVYVMPLGGLMGQASIGGQRISYVPIGSAAW